MRIKILFLLAILISTSLAVTAQEQDEHPHWTYEGEEGPAHWGELSEAFALCNSGKTQSPINIADAYSVDVSDIAFNYNASAINILNNGHTVQVNYDEGSSIVFNGVTYNLLQFHFHHPSEHTLNGEPAPMEIHFVHADADGNLAVVGVMLQEGAENTAYSDVLANLPTEETEVETLEGLTISAADLLPAEHTVYTYSGSLTTPPCSEGVRWLLMDHAVELSAAQIEAFTSIFENNARPVQPLNARDVLQDSTGM
ncbi:MAG: carbonic anhydrase [Anaerolineae bacterium]|nr:carbonic anhydrase [Anaerolineae bacterium]